jgi:uncharacterized protein (TIGR00730 family)
MAPRLSSQMIQELQSDVSGFLKRLPDLPHAEYIYQALMILLRMADEEIDRLDWKILRASLQDMEKAFQVFHHYRHTRKIAIFGSSRLPETSEEYKSAVAFARCVATRGFMVMTGAGGGIMEAANQGATAEHSFGLNIELPFEQSTNPFINGDPKCINFKYFFTRKLFFLREADAIALFPGGYGTQDEAFETLTLTQTGKSPPVPVVLVDKPGGTYWKEWDEYIRKQLISKELISPEDNQLYTITDNLDEACSAIADFYRVYHSSRYVGDRLVMRLNQDLNDAQVKELNQSFADIVLSGRIEKSAMLPEEMKHQQPQPQQVVDATEKLPRLVFHFNQRDYGRLYALISAINTMGVESPALIHPERK